MARDHGKLSVTIFLFDGISWEPTFICTETVFWKRVLNLTYFKIKEHRCVLLFTKNFNVY